jgi:transcriptional regulator GlxA family with amidase domain
MTPGAGLYTFSIAATVTFLALPDLEILDLAGPLQVFGEAKYAVQFVSTSPSVTTSQGLTLSALERLPEPSSEMLLVIPGTPYARTETFDRSLVRWVRRVHEAGALVTSVCTGAFLLGEAGLLDGRECTTHWSRLDHLARRFPRATVLRDRLFVEDGRIMTSAGIASGIDMALAIVERDRGPYVASEVAREMVVYIRRDESQKQTSVYLDYRSHLNPAIHRLQDWIVRNPEVNASIAQLAEIAGMSERNLTRVFRNATGVSIKQYTTRLRLELARSLMHSPELTLDAVARRCGYSSARQLRRLLQSHSI